MEENLININDTKIGKELTYYVQGKPEQDYYLLKRLKVDFQSDIEFNLESEYNIVFDNEKRKWSIAKPESLQDQIHIVNEFINLQIFRASQSEIELEEPTRKKTPAYSPNSIYIEYKPYNIKSLSDMVDVNDIIVQTDFQRNFIWDKTRQSKLIESLFLNLPLPTIYFSQTNDGKLMIVDGLQRISTINAFFKDSLTLNNLEYLEDFNGKTYSDLKTFSKETDDRDFSLRWRLFNQTQIVCYVIDRRSPYQLKFDLFRRLNSGGRPLNNAEIRNCLTLEKVTNRLIDALNNDCFKQMTGHSEKNDDRMIYRDAILRVLWLYSNLTLNEDFYAATEGIADIKDMAQFDVLKEPFKEILKGYNGDIDTELDKFIDILNDYSESNLNNIFERLSIAFNLMYNLYPNGAFRKVSSKVKKLPVNKSLFVSFLSIFMHNQDESVQRKVSLLDSAETREAFEKYLVSSDIFMDSITNSTNSRRNLIVSVLSVSNFLKATLKLW